MISLLSDFQRKFQKPQRYPTMDIFVCVIFLTLWQNLSDEDDFLTSLAVQFNWVFAIDEQAVLPQGLLWILNVDI